MGDDTAQTKSKSSVLLSNWRGFGGGPVTLDSVQFDKQLDKVSFWLEQWNHNTRCQILEALLRRSGQLQLRFLWTVIQPAMHRDFMITAKKDFPAQPFIPISTHTSRDVKKRYDRSIKEKYVRIQSAHFQRFDQVKEVTREVRLPDISMVTGYCSISPSSLVTSSEAITGPASGSHQVSSSMSRHSTYLSSSRTSPAKSMTLSVAPTRSTTVSLPQMSSRSRKLLMKTPKPRTESAPNKLTMFDRDVVQSSLNHLHSAPACIRFVEMPVRRHIQEEESPRFQPETDLSGIHNGEPLITSMNWKQTNDKYKISLLDCLPEETGIPKEGWQLIYWYSELWNDPQRNEFLHKTLLKLDQRQHYFLSGFLSIKHHIDILALLPETIALKILGYFTPKQIISASRVSRYWRKLCSNNDLWKQKCYESKLKMPITSVNSHMPWKEIFQENMYLKLNWEQGRYNVVDCKGHSDKVLSVTFDHKYMATGSADKTIRIWSVSNGRCIQTLQGHTKGVWCVQFFTKNLLISASYDSTIKVWNMRDGSCARTLLGHEGPVWSVVRRGNTLASASQDRTAKIWDISRCILLMTLKGHNGAVFCLDMDENGKKAFTGSADRTVRIWDVESGEQLRVIWLPQGSSVMSVSHSKGWLACCHSNTIFLYRLDKIKLVRKFEEHEKRVECVQLRMSNTKTPEGTMMSVGQDGVLLMWDINSENSTRTFTGHSTWINAVHFDDTRIATASYDNKIKIWDFNIF